MLIMSGDDVELTLTGNYKKLSLINDKEGVYYLRFNEDMGNYCLTLTVYTVMFYNNNCFLLT